MKLVILPIVPYLGLLLGLLIAWRHRDRKISAGHRLVFGLFHQVGPRLYLFVAPDTNQLCPACRDTHGTAFLPRLAEAPGFSPLGTPCKTPDVCASVLIGFHGGWKEANYLAKHLAASKSDGWLKLSQEELVRFSKGWRESIPDADRDLMGIQMLTALSTERRNPIQSAAAYGTVIDKAKEEQHLSLLVPAYLRLTSLLAQRGDPKRAIQIIEHFEKRYYRSEPGPYYPSAKQRRAMAVMKPYLLSMSDPSNSDVQKPATTPS